MKKLIFALIMFSLFACNKPDDEIDEKQLDPNENWIEYFDLQPKSGTTITKPTTVTATVKYNISLNELEGLGFYISLWHSYEENANWQSSPAFNAKLDRRSSEALVPFLTADENFILNNKGVTVYYRIAITRKLTEKTSEFIVQSVPIHYSIN